MKILKVLYVLSPERFCPDPPLPGSNGGTYDWDPSLTGRTPFGTAVKYGCGEGRKLMRGIDEGSGAPILYDEFFTFCQWNQTYAKDPTVVSCLHLFI